MQLLTRHSDESKTFAESVCWAIGNLAFPDDTNQSRLGVAGAGDIV